MFRYQSNVKKENRLVQPSYSDHLNSAEIKYPVRGYYNNLS